MAITIETMPTTAIDASGNEILFQVSTNRLKKIETTYTINAAATHSGGAKTELTVSTTPSDLVVGDILTVSTVYGRANIYSIDTANKKIVIDKAFVSTITGTCIRTNEQYRIQCAIILKNLDNSYSKVFNKYIYPYWNTTESKMYFDIDMSEIAKKFLLPDKANGSAVVATLTSFKSVAEYSITFYDWFLDENFALKNENDTTSNDYLVTLMNLKDTEAITDFLITSTVTGKFLTDNNYLRCDFTKSYFPSLQFIVDGNFRLDINRTVSISITNSGVNRFLIDLSILLATYPTFVNTTSLTFEIVIGSNVRSTFKIYNNKRTTKNKKTVIFSNRLGAYDSYEFVDVVRELKTDSDISLKDKTYSKNFADFDKETTYIGQYESNETLTALSQILYSTSVFEENNEIVVTTKDIEYFNEDVKQFNIKALNKKEY